MEPREGHLEVGRDTSGDGEQSDRATNPSASSDQRVLQAQIERSGLPCEALAPDQGFVVSHAGFRIALRQEHDAVLASLVIGDLPDPRDPAAVRQLLRWAREAWLEAGLSLAALADGRILLTGVVDLDGDESAPHLMDQLDTIVAMATGLRSQIVLTLTTESAEPADSTMNWLPA